jgi:hypothetical protein
MQTLTHLIVTPANGGDIATSQTQQERTYLKYGFKVLILSRILAFYQRQRIATIKTIG